MVIPDLSKSMERLCMKGVEERSVITLISPSWIISSSLVVIESMKKPHLDP